MVSAIRSLIVVAALVAFIPGSAQDRQAGEMTEKELMNELITPSTNTIWGAYQLQGDQQWAEVRDAAARLLVAGEALVEGGTGEGERTMAGNAEWQTFTAQMLEATRKVLAAIEARDEEAMSAAGNDDLYPPCESCHRRFQTR